MRGPGAVAVALLACLGCVPGPRRDAARLVPVPRSAADSITSTPIAPGITWHHLVRLAGPQRAELLAVDLRACVRLSAVKGSATAVGRRRTSELLADLPAVDAAVAAINADFFSFTPPGVPVGAMVSDGRVLGGPVSRPVVAIDSSGAVHLTELQHRGVLAAPRGEMVLAWWNRPVRGELGVLDAAWGQPVDSTLRRGVLMLVPVDRDSRAAHRVVGTLPAAHPGMAAGDTLLLVGADSGVRIGDSLHLHMQWTPVTPREAVGGFPWLLRNGALSATLDRDGAASFRGPNPRTAVGRSADGTRLFLLVIDGRRAGYSAGTTTRETAEWLQALGAWDAVNLDGGGSSALVVRDLRDGAVRVVNRPSDAAGERAVANALVVHRCRSK